MSANVLRLAEEWLTHFGAAVLAHDIEAIISCFQPDGWFRDALVLTWNSRSLGGHESIRNYLAHNLGNKSLYDFTLDKRPTLGPSPCTIGSKTGVELAFTFETEDARCRGLARLVESSGSVSSWRAISVFAMVDEWKGHEEVGSELGIYEGHTIPWDDVHAQRQRGTEEQPYVVVGT
jgi:hypothetical protein